MASSPAPWRWKNDQGYSELKDATGNMVLWYTTDDDGVHASPDDEEMIVLSRNALDVLQRREWNLITLGNGLWYASGKEGLIGPRGDPVCDSHPFKALVLADEWWKEKKE